MPFTPQIPVAPHPRAGRSRARRSERRPDHRDGQATRLRFLGGGLRPSPGTRSRIPISNAKERGAVSKAVPTGICRWNRTRTTQQRWPLRTCSCATASSWLSTRAGGGSARRSSAPRCGGPRNQATACARSITSRRTPRPAGSGRRWDVGPCSMRSPDGRPVLANVAPGDDALMGPGSSSGRRRADRRPLGEGGGRSEMEAAADLQRGKLTLQRLIMGEHRHEGAVRCD